MVKKKRYLITIEDRVENTTLKWEYDLVDCSQSLGVERDFRFESPKVRYNGKQKLALNAWIGCSGPADFGDTEVNHSGTKLCTQ